MEESTWTCIRARPKRGAEKLFFVAGDSTWLGGVDGRVGIHARAGVPAAFATKNSWDAFLVGLAASVGAGIRWDSPKRFRRRVADGRGRPFDSRIGVRTDDHRRRDRTHASLSDPRFPAGDRDRGNRGGHRARVISYIRHRYMDTPWYSAAFQVGVGGVLVLITGILIGSS